MTTPTQFLAAARSNIDYTEEPPGTNCNRFSHSLGRPCERWCADFLVSIADRVGLALPSRSASTQWMLDAFRHAGRAHASPQVGDFAFWQFDSDAAADHVSVVESIGTTTITTIDGNSSVSGSQSNGGQVCRRTRPSRLVIAYGRPAYSLSPPPQPHPEDNMTSHPLSVPLGADGTGWAYIEVPKDNIVSMVVNGADIEGKPPGRAIVTDAHAWATGSRIVVRAAAPGSGRIDLAVWSSP